MGYETSFFLFKENSKQKQTNTLHIICTKRLKKNYINNLYFKKINNFGIQQSKDKVTFEDDSTLDGRMRKMLQHNMKRYT